MSLSRPKATTFHWPGVSAGRVELTREQCRALGDRRFGVGADQILVVEKSATPGVDYITPADGSQVLNFVLRKQPSWR